MTKITTVAELKEAIQVLEIEQKAKGAQLKEQFKITYESLRPANLIGNTLKELTSLPDLKGNLLNTTIGLAAGFLSKKVAVGNTHNPLKILLGTLLQMGVTSVVSKNADGIKTFTGQVLTRLTSSKKTN